MHSRAKFVGSMASLSTIGILRWPSGAAEFSYKLSTVAPAKYPPVAACIDVADKLLQESGGRLEIKVFPSSQLGRDTEIISQVRLGAVEITQLADLYVAGLVPAAAATSLPFIVSNEKELLSMVTGDFANYLHGAFEKAGIFTFPGSWDVSGGLRQIGNNVHPIVTPADLKGIKLRSTSDPQEVAAIKAISGAPTVVAQADVYPGLQTHLIDGFIIGAPAVEVLKLYEVTKYYSIVNYGGATGTIFMNPEAFRRLPSNLQTLMMRTFETARNSCNADFATGAVAAVDHLKAHGMVVNQGDVLSFQRAIRSAGMYAEWKSTYGSQVWAMMEKSVGRRLG